MVHGRLAMREARLAAARAARHGLQVMTFEQAAVRLAGGFARPIDRETLRVTLQAVLPNTALGELDAIKTLPGMVSAAADTLRKLWLACVNLPTTNLKPRLEAIMRLEAAVIAALPAGMLRPGDLVAAARARLVHAETVLGRVQILGMTELEPCWRSLLLELAQHIDVQWVAGPREVPPWLQGSAVQVLQAQPETPTRQLVRAATAYHEAIEAMRWARALLARGVTPSDIGIAAASTAEYDEHFLALRGDANLDLHFVHGIPVVSTYAGQAAAALADVVVRGLSSAGMRRLARYGKDSRALGRLPEAWTRVLPAEAPLSNVTAWHALLDRLLATDWPDGQDHAQDLRQAVDLLAQGSAAASQIGEAFLQDESLAIWRKALLTGPAAAIDVTLANLKQDDGLESCVSVAWMPASELAASPRAHVRLLGMNSSRWPRGISEDRLIPDHIIPTGQMDPLPVNLADRRDFHTIQVTTSQEIVLSLARRDREGRLLGRSPLLSDPDPGHYLGRNAVPLHAYSETDRLLARPDDFAADPQAINATACWRNWHSPELTPHDGIVRMNHPLLLEILQRRHSASSLKLLLRNPLGFVWRYGFRWESPTSAEEPLTLPALPFGDLVHRVLDQALQELEDAGGLSKVDEQAIAQAIERATAIVADDFQYEQPIPPQLIWQSTLAMARKASLNALRYGRQLLPGSRSYGEVPFGGAESRTHGAVPWDSTTPVQIPGTAFRIGGYIDRLDVAADGAEAIVRDYKTGRPPRKPFQLKGGSELQRCLYAFAVKALLGEQLRITASLLYPIDEVEFALENPEAVLNELIRYLQVAGSRLAEGAAVPGPDAAGDYDDLAFALPGNAAATYCVRKQPAVHRLLADLTPLWEME